MNSYPCPCHVCDFNKVFTVRTIKKHLKRDRSHVEVSESLGGRPPTHQFEAIARTVAFLESLALHDTTTNRSPISDDSDTHFEEHNMADLDDDMADMSFTFADISMRTDNEDEYNDNDDDDNCGGCSGGSSGGNSKNEDEEGTGDDGKPDNGYDISKDEKINDDDISDSAYFPCNLTL